MLGVVVWDAKEEEGNSLEYGNFGKQMFTGSAETIGQRGILTNRLAGFLPFYTPSSCCSFLW